MKYIAPLPRPHGRFTNVYVIKEAELSIDMSGETEEEELTSILSAYLFSCYFQLVTISFDKCNVTDTFASHLSIRHLRVCHFAVWYAYSYHRDGGERPSERCYLVAVVYVNKLKTSKPQSTTHRAIQHHHQVLQSIRIDTNMDTLLQPFNSENSWLPFLIPLMI